MSEHKNLAQKFVKIMESVQHVPKNGRNTHFNYDYVLESDALDKVRSEFVKHGVAFFPSVNAVEKTGDITGVHLQMLLVDSESGEEMTLTWYGEGQDKQDKGAYKAYTGGLKYWVLKTFLVGTGDDPEREYQHSNNNAPQQKTAPDEFDRKVRIPFGKHKDTPLMDIPSDYLQWLTKNANEEEWKTFAQKELEEREFSQVVEDEGGPPLPEEPPY